MINLRSHSLQMGPRGISVFFLDFLSTFSPSTSATLTALALGKGLVLVMQSSQQPLPQKSQYLIVSFSLKTKSIQERQL